MGTEAGEPDVLVLLDARERERLAQIAARRYLVHGAAQRPRLSRHPGLALEEDLGRPVVAGGPQAGAPDG